MRLYLNLKTLTSLKGDIKDVEDERKQELAELTQDGEYEEAGELAGRPLPSLRMAFRTQPYFVCGCGDEVVIPAGECWQCNQKVRPQKHLFIDIVKNHVVAEGLVNAKAL